MRVLIQESNIEYLTHSTSFDIFIFFQQNTEYKKELDILRNSVSDYEITIAANQNHIQQMMHKLEELNNDHSEKIMQYDLEKSSLRSKCYKVEQVYIENCRIIMIDSHDFYPQWK